MHDHWTISEAIDAFSRECRLTLFSRDSRLGAVESNVHRYMVTKFEHLINLQKNMRT